MLTACKPTRPLCQHCDTSTGTYPYIVIVLAARELITTHYNTVNRHHITCVPELSNKKVDNGSLLFKSVCGMPLQVVAPNCPLKRPHTQLSPLPDIIVIRIKHTV